MCSEIFSRKINYSSCNISSFGRICLFRFSADKILTKRASSENKIRTRGGEGSFERATREAKQQLKELKW